jgi:hypothetical protein
MYGFNRALTSDVFIMAQQVPVQELKKKKKHAEEVSKIFFCGVLHFSSPN